MDRYAADNLPGTPCGSRKKPNAGRSPASRLWMADANSHMPCRAMLMQRCAVALRSRFQNGMVVAWHVWIKARHGRGTAWVQKWERHGMCELAFTQVSCKSHFTYQIISNIFTKFSKKYMNTNSYSTNVSSFPFPHSITERPISTT
jgi:hypothetical protein